MPEFEDEEALEQRKLILALDEASLNYLEVRIQFYRKKLCREPIAEIDAKRTRIHDHLIKCFLAVLKDFEGDVRGMDEIKDNRGAIGNWGMRRALMLLTG